MMDCKDLRQFYDEYALGVLEGEERAEIDAHLARRCDACTPGIEGARWLVSQLAYAAPPQQPPAAIRARILQATAAESRQQRAPQSKLSPQRAWIPAWAWAAAAVLVIFATYSLYQNRQMRQQIDQLDAQMHAAETMQHSLQAQRDSYNRAMAILSAPGTIKMEMKPSTAGMPALQAFVHAKMGVVVAASGIPMPAAGRAFQLWMVPKAGKGAPISAGIYMPDANGGVLTVAPPPADMSDMAALAVTDEPSGGSAQPTTKPMWVAALQ